MSVGVKVPRCSAAIVERQSLCGNKCAVVAVGKRVHAQRAQQYREGIHDSLQINLEWPIRSAQSMASYTHRGIQQTIFTMFA
jgi:hypothetical protein